jgi:peptidoglycan-associated lipoprotein
MALGERRSQAVANYLAAKGVSRSQMDLISLGEERPEMLGSNETAWAKNRRVVIEYSAGLPR